MKRELQTLYIKYDGHFKTLSKISLAQLILKIVHLKGDGTSLRQIEVELSVVLLSTVPRKDIEAAISYLIKEKKLHAKSNRHFIHPNYKKELDNAIQENDRLHDYIINKYFNQAESSIRDIKIWFQDTTILFFEKYSYEWFQQVTTKRNYDASMVPNICSIADETLITANNILSADKDWLKQQYCKFFESDGPEEVLLFWFYGISMLSSRLITAKNYADKITIEMFKDSKLILDTNILMILDLEGHELSDSLIALESVLMNLNIKLSYFCSTREEYLRAMSAKHVELVNVFENYDIDVLNASECPFIKTAIKRGCCKGEDIDKMFQALMIIPEKFHSMICISVEDGAAIISAIEAGENNSELQRKINDIYKRRTKRDKRDRPLIHDAGMVNGAIFLRKTERCWIISCDSTMKLYAIQNCLRDEEEIVVGLDILLGLLAVNNGGAGIDASNFAPLFKNLVKQSLIPERATFEVRDLAFMLSTNTNIHQLPDDKVIEIAQQVKRQRICGVDDETISLFLRRTIEGTKIGIAKDLEEARNHESIAIMERNRAERERDELCLHLERKRRGELHDQYDRERRRTLTITIIIPIITGVLIFLSLIKLNDNNSLVQYLIGIGVEVAVGIIFLIPVRKRIFSRYSEKKIDIDLTIRKEIEDIKKNANQ